MAPSLISETFSLDHKADPFLGVHFVIPIPVGVGVKFLFCLVAEPSITVVDRVI